MHSSGSGPDALDRVLKNLTDSKKAGLYPKYVRSYKKWMGKKRIAWTGCETMQWKSGDLVVNVNPELGLQIDGLDHMIKLYFRQGKELSPRRAEVMLYLFDSAVRANDGQIATPAIMDVRRGKLLPFSSGTNPALAALLQGEALSFTGIWQAV
jgi:hypothetical protein